MAKILVVDDEAPTAELCQDVLERLGHEVTTAFSTQQFVRCLKAEKYHLLISDISMPGMDGFSCCERALSLQPEISILMMTGMTELDSVVESILTQQPFRLLRKPFNIEKLENAVNACLKNKEN
ncbi:MAG: response regulator [Candidatus Omnitrophica bacterium]|nr:response regulator [Candidatus Omnitrophota bacterium]